MKKYRLKNIVLFLSIIFLQASCAKEKDAEPPEFSFKKGSNYLSANASVGKGEVYTIGVIADKSKRDLRKFEVNVSYDGGGYDQHLSYLLKNDEKSHFERDVKITTRNELGSERWQFEISDIDGSTSEMEISLAVN